MDQGSARVAGAAVRLGVELAVADEACVREQFRRSARRLHPDRGGHPRLFDQLVRDRDALLAWLATRPRQVELFDPLDADGPRPTSAVDVRVGAPERRGDVALVPSPSRACAQRQVRRPAGEPRWVTLEEPPRPGRIVTVWM